MTAIQREILRIIHMTPYPTGLARIVSHLSVPATIREILPLLDELEVSGYIRSRLDHGAKTFVRTEKEATMKKLVRLCSAQHKATYVVVRFMLRRDCDPVFSFAVVVLNTT